MTDADRCEAVARTHARTFSLAATLLPADKRRGVFALYAFCRHADDIVDRAARASDARNALAAHRASLDATIGGNAPTAEFRELAWAIERYALPRAPLDVLIDGVARDLEPVRYADWPALAGYSAAVASSVGEMCARVFGVARDPVTFTLALHHARTLGVAMQLTNILRDVGEDARRQRCYLPDDELEAHGLSRDLILQNVNLAGDSRWHDLMRFQIARARELYAEADAGIALLAPDSQRCALACALGYAEILNAIERQSYDTLNARAVVRPWRKASVLWHAWREAPALRVPV